MRLRPADLVRGEVLVPGDKSISHRALLIAAMAEGDSVLRGRAPGQDQDSMVACLGRLGVAIEETAIGTIVRGRGLRGLTSPEGVLDCGNSGATLRFLCGALAGIPGVAASLGGDHSLSRRPMERVAAPLRAMGALIATAAGGTAPVQVTGTVLRGVEHRLEVASAQVKTAILLAGLNAEGVTRVREPVLSRDHTERLLRRLGVKLEPGVDVVLDPPAWLPRFDLTIPGDPSSAAFWVVLATIHPDAELTLSGVGINPTRIGFLSVLGRMGADIQVVALDEVDGEPAAQLTVRSASLHGVRVAADEVPSMIDEVPVLAVAAALAEGETVFQGLGELRVKEVDRLDAIAVGLREMGIEALVDGDDLSVAGGGQLRGGRLDSGGDHRLAMAWAVAAAVSQGDTELAGSGAAAVSYPGFFDQLAAVSG